ncbi:MULTISPECIES: cupin-like domain-containing protein [Nostoc]|uniref:Cupin-like domain-containing protein n=2 Tax=Nostoc TaxID=1177 RepID=A0ABR8I1M0_9NOSO|nr:MULTISPECIES: cupin-like domain-containing protein [Nostoc]MBD2559791.1 cupin-like domain-containing protein [Nostoc linckia FACHB-391]MBD2645245.1 cupin-like domain-containing protein [Nostoc foliaceum FACHB-393]
MTLQLPIYFYQTIWFSFAIITLIIGTRLLIFMLMRMWRKQKYKLVWTPISSIERRSNLSYDEFFREYSSVGKPVIITDAMKDWPASTKWTLDFFNSECGSLKASVREDGDYKKQLQITIGDYIDYLTADERSKTLYLFDFHPYNYPQLYNDYKVPVYFPNWFDRLPKKFQEKYDYPLDYIMIGGKGCSIGLHVDGGYTYAWLALISGKKRCALFTPDQTEFLYNGKVDVFNPDLEKFPLYAKVKPVETILEPGEILYIPTRWWHQVETLEDSIALSHNTINEFNAELCFQDIYKHSPINSYILPLALEFPLVTKSLFALNFFQKRT